jgi:hypothetical protein
MSRKECFDPNELHAVQAAFDEAAQRLSLDNGPAHQMRRQSLAVAILAMYDESAVADMSITDVVQRFSRNTSFDHASM